MDHVCRTAAFDRHEYLGTRYNRARIRAMFRKVDGGESKRGQINKEGNGSSLSILYLSYNGHIYACFRVAIAFQRYIGSLQSSWKVLPDTPARILIFSASHLELKRSSHILTDIPLLLKYMQRLQIEGREGGEREIRCFDGSKRRCNFIQCNGDRYWHPV